MTIIFFFRQYELRAKRSSAAAADWCPEWMKRDTSGISAFEPIGGTCVGPFQPAIVDSHAKRGVHLTGRNNRRQWASSPDSLHIEML
jgi:hypothetical protein